MAPVFHSFQYLALTSWYACHGKGHIGPGRFAGYLILVLILGLGFNPGVTLLFAHVKTVAGGLAVAAATTSFVNLHHFLLDGRIWRLRERPVVQSMIA